MNKKIIIITDSTGNPRVNINNEKVDLENTFPYLIKKNFIDYKFWQLSFASISTKQLLSQAQTYLVDWEPDIIIVHSGINECKPSIFSEENLKKLFSFFGYFSKYLKILVYNPLFIKFFNKTITTSKKFERDINIFKNYFPKSEIFWIEISCEDILDKRFPGVLKNVESYNSSLKKIFKENFINVTKNLKTSNGFLKDGLHYNENGHKVIYIEINKRL